jgi:hypothetical protein
MASDKIGLGDVVVLGFGNGYNVATVTQVHKDGTVDLLRPYVHTGDVSYSGSDEGSSRVLGYLGFEEVKRVNPERLDRLRKGDPVR